MTFLTVGALAIAILILVPTIAHLLQRGRQDAIGFPLGTAHSKILESARQAP